MTNEFLIAITKKYESPLYVYDAEKIISQYNKLTNAFASVKNIKINYAAKALSNISVLKIFNSLQAGLDTVSVQEVQLGLKAGFDPKDIIFTPNGVSLDEIEQAMDLGVQINIDNISILEQFGQKHPEVPVCIRMNPHVMAGGNQKISVGHIDSKFGISIHQVRHLKRIVEACNLHINGVHMHTGSDILDIEAFLRGAELLMDVALDFPELEYIDFGSGFKVPYKPNDAETNIEELRVRTWEKRDTALCLLVDRSGSMGGAPLATSAVAAAAIATREPTDYSVLAFSRDVVVAKSQDSYKPGNEVVNSVLTLRGFGTTDIAQALEAAQMQLSRSRAARKIVVLLSDCRSNEPGDIDAVARAIEELVVIAPADDDAEARAFALRVGARVASVTGPTGIPAALAQVLDS